MSFGVLGLTFKNIFKAKDMNFLNGSVSIYRRQISDPYRRIGLICASTSLIQNSCRMIAHSQRVLKRSTTLLLALEATSSKAFENEILIVRKTSTYL